MSYFSNIRIIFWGTPEFAIPFLEALIKSGYKIIAVVTNPDEPVGRKPILTPPSVKQRIKNYELRIKNELRIFQPSKLKDNKEFIEQIREFEPDLFVVAAYGKIIPKEILEIPKFGAVNIHPSLLPRWRGPSPIQYTILYGDKELGVTIMKMDELMDHGPIIAKSKTKNQKLKITYTELHDELAKLGAELLVEVLPKWLKGEITLISQDDAKATYSKLLKKEDGRIDWSRPAEEIERMIRAFNPWPGAWTMWPTDKKIYRLRIEEADVSEKETSDGSCGFVWQNTGNSLLVKTSRKNISIRKLKLEGKKTLRSEDFLKGYKNVVGSTFI